LKHTPPRAFQYIERELKAVEETLRNNVRSSIPLVPRVGRYLFDSGGKRIRPSLLLLSARLCGYRWRGDGRPNRSVNIASMIELLHTATLLHDDVIDDAKVRRGIASVNSVWGNRVSILMGDYLFSRASSIFSEDNDSRIMRSLFGTIIAMIEGELIQLNSSMERKVSERHYLSVIRKKTAMLFASCCECGAIIGGGTRTERDSLKNFGLSLGIAFQVVDDNLDYSHPESFGKALGTDLKNGKLTLPLIYAFKDCTPKEKKEIMSILSSAKPSENGFRRALELIYKYRGLERSERKARSYVEAAKDCLGMFPSSPDKDALLWMADYVVERKQ